MAGDWEDLTFGDLGRIVTGKTPLTAIEQNFGGQIPFVTRSDMDGRRTISTTARNLTEVGAASVKGSKIPAGSVMGSCIGSDMETLEYVEIFEVSRGNIANIATYPRGEEPSRARRRLRHGDTVLSTVRPDRGSYFLALNPPDNRVASTGFAVLTPTKAPWSFIHAAMTQQEVSDHLGQMADGGAYPAVCPEFVGAMKVAEPNEPKILEAFHRPCVPLFEQAEANRTQSRTLAPLRDTLLPKLLGVESSVAIGGTSAVAAPSATLCWP